MEKQTGFSAETPELTTEEKVAWMELQGKNLTALFSPDDYSDAPVLEVNKEIKTKTQASRIRNTLFVLWKQLGEQGRYEDFYNDKTEKYINNIKGLFD